jgi:uncharacterized protein (TIGR03067 family)
MPGGTRMRAAAVMLVTAGFVAAVDRPAARDLSQAKARAVEQELRKLQGVWLAISFESRSGKNEEVGAGLKIEKDAFALGMGHGMIEGSIVIDPTAQPRSWDFRFKVKDEPQIWLCIYELDGDRLRLCVGDEKKRPSSFPGKSGSKEDFGLYVFKRAKARR